MTKLKFTPTDFHGKGFVWPADSNVPVVLAKIVQEIFDGWHANQFKELKPTLDRIRATCGHPDAALVCRIILGFVDEIEEKINV